MADVSDELRFAENMGQLFEKAGVSRMAGRVWGYLLIAEAPAISAADLGHALGASAGSISSATRLLVSQGLADRIRMPGEQRDYFTVGEGAIVNLVWRRLEALEAVEHLARRALERFADRPAAQARLSEMCEVYSFLAREFSEVARRFLAGSAPAGADRSGGR